MSGDVTYQALERLSHMPDNPSNPADAIAGQKYYDVAFTGGTIVGITPSGLPTPLAVSDGGTGGITAQAARNNLLPAQAAHSGQVLKTDGTNVSWSADIDTGITQLTGDVTAGPGNGSQVATLATVNSNVGTFGGPNFIPVITIDGKGRITAASSSAVGNAATATLAASATVLATPRNIGGVSFNGSADITVASATGGFTVSGGNLAVGVNNISLTGALGTTGSRVSKGWFTDVQVTNPISGSVTGNAGTVTTNANLTGLVTSVGNATSLVLGQLTTSLASDVNLNNTGTYFDGPTVAQGSTGTWFVSGTVTVKDTASGSPDYVAKLWDGTTTIATCILTGHPTATKDSVIPLSGFISSPAGNLRISVKDPSTTTGKIVANDSGTGKDSTISAFRIA